MWTVCEHVSQWESGAGGTQFKERRKNPWKVISHEINTAIKYGDILIFFTVGLNIKLLAPVEWTINKIYD